MIKYLIKIIIIWLRKLIKNVNVFENCIEIKEIKTNIINPEYKVSFYLVNEIIPKLNERDLEKSEIFDNFFKIYSNETGEDLPHTKQQIIIQLRFF